MKSIVGIALTATVLFTLSACQTSTDQSEEREALQAMYSDVNGPAIFSHVGTPEGLSAIPVNQPPYPAVYAQFTDAFASTEEWLTVSKRILNLKDEMVHTEPEIAFFYVEQMAAIHIIGKAAFDSMFVDDATWNDEQIALLSDQVDILVHNRNPQATLIAPALKQLQGYWPESRIKEAAQIASDAAINWIEQDRKRDMPEGMLAHNEALAYRLYTEASEDLRLLAQ